MFLKLGDQFTEDLDPIQGWKEKGLEKLDWFKYRTQEKEVKYGGGIQSSASMMGKYGEYYLTEGYFVCANPFQFASTEAIQSWKQKQFNDQNMINDSTRAMIFSGTIYHQQTGYFINFNILSEQGPDSSLLGSNLEITPFLIYGLMNDETRTRVILLTVARCFCLVWIIINTVFTIRKKKTPNEAVSW